MQFMVLKGYIVTLNCWILKDQFYLKNIILRFYFYF